MLRWFKNLIDAVLGMEKVVLNAQNKILQLVGVGDDWNRAEAVCSRFRELKQLFVDALLAAMEGRASLQSLLNTGALS